MSGPIEGVKVRRVIELRGESQRAGARPGEHAARTGSLDFSSLYDTWFVHVARWLRALGAPTADIEDLAQEVFLVVRRRLPDFDGRNVPGWLYRIASGQVRRFRRQRWFQRVLARSEPVDLEQLPSAATSAIATLELREKQLVLERLVAKMSEKRRVAFWLFEVEGYSGDEIAEVLDIPVNTLWTRLHHARKEFFTLLAEYRRTHAGAP